jgi:hypothetical protein
MAGLGPGELLLSLRQQARLAQNSANSLRQAGEVSSSQFPSFQEGVRFLRPRLVSGILPNYLELQSPLFHKKPLPSPLLSSSSASSPSQQNRPSLSSCTMLEPLPSHHDLKLVSPFLSELFLFSALHRSLSSQMLHADLQPSLFLLSLALCKSIDSPYFAIEDHRFVSSRFPSFPFHLSV